VPAIKTAVDADLALDRRARIVWADDNADMRDYVRCLLTPRHDVIAVSDGIAALDAARASIPDLVLSDVMMPGLDGFGLLRALRADDRTRAAPVILLSARAGAEATLEGLDAEADDYLAKPFSSRELLARVRTHLELSKLRRDFASRASQRRLHALVQHSADLISIVDGDALVTYITPTIETILGYKTYEMVGRRLRDHVHPTDQPIAATVFAQLRQRPGGVARGVYRMRHKDGTWRWMESTAVNMLLDPDVAGIVVNQRDVTEQRRIEEQARHSQKLDAIGQLAGGVAHDFNNMLSVILGECDLIDPDRFSPSEIRRELTEIQGAATRAASFTRQLLAFSRRQVLEPRVVDLNEHIRSIAMMLRRVIGESVRLVEDLAHTLDRTLVDPAQIEQVVVNLAVNARDAMPNGGVLTIETRNVTLDESYTREHPDVTPGDYVALIVTDTGVGMDAATQARIFEPFFTTKDRGRGTGLGLAMAHGVVRQSGGHIWVYSEMGRGATFRLYFPSTIDATPQAAGSIERVAAPRGAETLLVVEDDDALRRISVRVLSANGYRVLDASGSEEALPVAAAHPDIALVLTDVIMSGLNGRALVEQLRRTSPHLKAIFTWGTPTTPSRDMVCSIPACTSSRSPRLRRYCFGSSATSSMARPSGPSLTEPPSRHATGSSQRERQMGPTGRSVERARTGQRGRPHEHPIGGLLLDRSEIVDERLDPCRHRGDVAALHRLRERVAPDRHLRTAVRVQHLTAVDDLVDPLRGEHTVVALRDLREVCRRHFQERRNRAIAARRRSVTARAIGLEQRVARLHPRGRLPVGRAGSHQHPRTDDDHYADGPRSSAVHAATPLPRWSTACMLRAGVGMGGVGLEGRSPFTTDSAPSARPCWRCTGHRRGRG
jgi:PAS domain S-box-containing protein